MPGVSVVFKILGFSGIRSGKFMMGSDPSLGTRLFKSFQSNDIGLVSSFDVGVVLVDIAIVLVDVTVWCCE